MGRTIVDLDPAEVAAVRKRVFAYAIRLVRDPVRGEELTQEAFARLFTVRPWNEDLGSSLAKYLMRTVRSLASHEAATRRERPHDDVDELAELEERDGPAELRMPSAEAMHVDREDGVERRSSAADAVEGLRARLAGNALELEMLDAMLDDTMEPASLAAKLQRPITEIYRALERIRRRARRKDEEVP